MQPEVETGGTKEEDDRRVTLGSAYFPKNALWLDDEARLSDMIGRKTCHSFIMYEDAKAGLYIITSRPPLKRYLPISWRGAGRYGLRFPIGWSTSPPWWNVRDRIPSRSNGSLKTKSLRSKISLLNLSLTHSSASFSLQPQFTQLQRSGVTKPCCFYYSSWHYHVVYQCCHIYNYLLCTDNCFMHNGHYTWICIILVKGM